MTLKTILTLGLLHLVFITFHNNRLDARLTPPTESDKTTNGGPATETVESLKKMVLETTLKIDSIRILCRGEYLDRSLVDANAFHQVTLFAKAPHSLFYDSAHGHDYMNWQLDPYRQKAYVRKEHVYNEYPLDRMFFRQLLKPQDPLPGSLQTAFFFLATGYWPTTGREAPRHADLPYVLRDVALSKETHLHLRPDLEKVGGRWCHVLEQTNADALWIDVGRAGCLVQRELFDSKTGRRLQRYRLAEQEEFSPQIWIPRVIENTVFEQHDQEKNAHSDHELTATTRILECQVNQVQDSDFDYQIPPGALELNELNVNEPPRQVIPGGLEQFDVMASWINDDRISTITVDNTGPTPSQGNTISVSAVTFPFALVVTLLLTCEIYLRFQPSTALALRTLPSSGMNVLGVISDRTGNGRGSKTRRASSE